MTHLSIFIDGRKAFDREVEELNTSERKTSFVLDATFPEGAGASGETGEPLSKYPQWAVDALLGTFEEDSAFWKWLKK